MNVLVVTPSRFFTSYGHPIRVLGQIQALVRRGIHVCVCSYGHGEDLEGITIRRIPLTPPNLAPGWHPARAYLDPLLSIATLAEALRHGYDLVHAHIVDGSAAALATQLIGRIPLIADLQDSVSELLASSGHSRPIVRIAQLIERLVVRRADQIVTSSSQLAREIRLRFQFADARISPLLDAVDTRLYDPKPWTPLREQTRAIQGIPKNRTVIAYVGSLSRRQGADTLIALAEAVTHRRLPWHFLVCGAAEPRYVSALKSLVLGGHLTYPGVAHYTNDVPRLLGAADIGISLKPTTSEGNGKLLHYMAMGLPVVAFDSEASRELLGNYGVYVPTTGSAEWIDALTDVIENLQERRAIGARLRVRTLHEFSWDVRIEDLLRIYARLQGAKQRHRATTHW